MTELAQWSAAQTAAAVARRDVSPVEVVEACIDRIERLNSSLNAVVFVGYDDARKAAKRAEVEVMQGSPLGPLHGVPTLMKDLFDFKPGWPATFGGIPSLAQFTVDARCPFVERVEAAGGIVVGKTNSPIMGFRGVCDNPLFGATRNPFDLERNSGGSSGGSAAAVASGMVPFAEGTDGGGSIRIPSAWCGTLGFQPSFGRVPFIVRPNALGNTMPFLYEGPISRTSADARLVLKALSGRDARDPFSFTSALEEPAEDRSFGPLRVGFTPDFGIFPVEPEIRGRIASVINDLASSGVVVEEVDLGLPFSQRQLSDLWCRQIMISNVATLLNFQDNGVDLLADNDGDMPETYLRWVEHARSMTLPEVIRDYEMRAVIIDKFAAAFETFDILLSPTVAAMPVLNSAQKGMTFGPDLIGDEQVDSSIGWCMTYFTNFTGHPAASVPVGSVNGLPVGMQVMGSRFGDGDVLRFLEAFEARWPWSGMYARVEGGTAQPVPRARPSEQG